MDAGDGGLRYRTATRPSARWRQLLQGNATFHNPSGRKAYIMNMYTAPAYRNRESAYHTLELLVEEAKKGA